MSYIKKRSREWAKELKIAGIHDFGEKDPVKNPIITVYGPDGWDRKNWDKDIEISITKKEFKKKIMFSTCFFHKPFKDIKL